MEAIDISAPEKPKIGILAEDQLQRHLLQMVMQRYGFEVGFNREPQRLESDHGRCDLWLVDLKDEEYGDKVHMLLECEEPVLFGVGTAPKRGTVEYSKWEKRLYSKVTKVVGHDILKEVQQQSLQEVSLKGTEFRQADQQVVRPNEIPMTDKGQPAEFIWVLGASLGGPAAVKEFLDSLPEQLPIAFIYAQHIDQNFQSVLTQVLGRHAWFNLVKAEHNYQLKSGDVLMVPSDKEIQFARHRVLLTENEWKGPYGPSIDQVMVNVADGIGDAGYIIFSGMGNDGSEACAALQERTNGVDSAEGQNELQLSREIWAQNTDSCGSSSMPDSARETGTVKFSGTPTQLAQHLVQKLRKHYQCP